MAVRYSDILLAVVLVVAGCGSGPQETEPAARTPVSEPASGLYDVTGTAPAAVGPFASVVIFESAETTVAETTVAEITVAEITVAEITVTQAPEKPAVLDQFGTAFFPPVLLARVGQTVEFKNSEDQMHNVRVLTNVTRETQFNISTPMFAPPYEHVFEHSGVYDVSCGIHSAMAAYVVVVSTPWAVVTEDDGGFALSGVPAGNYRVTVWSPDPDRRSQHEIEIAAGNTHFLFEDG